MNKGKEFERSIKQCSEQQDILIIRLNDTDLSWNKEANKFTRFTATNIADFIAYKHPNIFFLELKSTEYNSISIQREIEETGKMIKLHQISDLTKVSLHDGVYAGFIFNFRQKDSLEEDTYWMNIKDFNNFLVNNDKHSINRLDIVQNNGIRMDQRLRRTKYFYDVDGLLCKIKDSQ